MRKKNLCPGKNDKCILMTDNLLSVFHDTITFSVNVMVSAVGDSRVATSRGHSHRPLISSACSLSAPDRAWDVVGAQKY